MSSWLIRLVVGLLGGKVIKAILAQAVHPPGEFFSKKKSLKFFENMTATNGKGPFKEINRVLLVENTETILDALLLEDPEGLLSNDVLTLRSVVGCPQR